MKTPYALRLSFWASQHRPAAITCIVFAKIVIGIIGYNLGFWAAIEGLALSTDLKWLLAAIAGISFWAYPSKRLKQHLGRAIFYRRQKSIDAVLATLGFATFFWLGNLAPGSVAQPQSQHLPVRILWSSMQREGAVNLPETTPSKPTTLQKTGRTGKLKQWFAQKIKKRIERKMERFVRLSGDSGTAEKILLTVLLLLLAFIALYLVAILACSLSCNGQEGLAVLVAVVGVSGIIIGLVFGFSRIWRKNDDADIKRRQRENRSPTEIRD